MAGDTIQYVGPPSATTYALIRSVNSGGMIWNLSGPQFVVFSSPQYANYAIEGTQQGTSGGGYYTVNVPSAMEPGVYNVVSKRQGGGVPLESDATLGVGDIQWGGSSVGIIPLSSLPSSGITAAARQVVIQRSRMVTSFPVYLRSATDHVTPMTSGIVSGQISRDGGSFGPLQSGAFTEIGAGFYKLQALTSGDLNANTVALLFTATGVSGGVSDPLALSVVTQPSSGY